MLPYVLFGIREVPQASTGFTPFELLFGRQPCGLLDVAREAWEQQPASHRSTLEHVREMRERIDRVMPLVQEHLMKAQQAQQRTLLTWAAQPWEFQPGDHVMILVPTTACKFLTTWQGPYTVTEKVGPVTYRVRQPGRRKEDQLYHINLLKQLGGDQDPTGRPGHIRPRSGGHELPALGCPEKGPAPPDRSILRCLLPGSLGGLRSYNMTSAPRQELASGSGPIVSLRLGDTPSRKRYKRCNEVSEFDGYPMP